LRGTPIHVTSMGKPERKVQLCFTSTSYCREEKHFIYPLSILNHRKHSVGDWSKGTF
jgi:hypothetical protein